MQGQPDGKTLFIRLVPYIAERSQICDSTLPNLEVQFRAMKNFPTDCYEAELHFTPIETGIKTRVAVGNAVMSQIKKMASLNPSKPRLNIAFCNAEDRFLCIGDNMLLRAPGLNQEKMDSVNYAVIDEMVDILLKNPSTHFPMFIKMHDVCIS